MPAFESVIFIRELSGRQRSVELRGPGLPLQGANWGGEQRTITTWYAGNATEGTQQTLGPIEKQTTWDGVWRTTQMSKTPSVLNEGGSDILLFQAFTLRDILEDIFRLGSKLRVTWANKERSLQREGRCIEWDFSYDRIDDIEWAMTWDWSGRGVRQQRAVSTRRNPLQQDLQSLSLVALDVTVIDQINTLASARRNVRLSADRFTLGQLENLANAPNEIARDFFRKAQQIVDRTKRIGELINTVRSLPFQLANQALDQANNAVSVANNFVDTISRRPAEQNSTRIKVSNLTRTASYFGQATTQAQLLARSGRRLRTSVESSAKQERTILATHITRQGETLQSISRRYYGTTDQAPTIAQANRLPLNQTVLEARTLIIIPTIEQGKSFTPQDG